MENEKRDDELLTDGKRFTLCIPQDMYAELCNRAKAEKMKVSVLVRAIIKEYFAKRKA
jgi:hypothetical protein